VPNAKQSKIKQPPVLFDRTQELVRKLEEHLGGALVTYWNNPRGEVCHNDVLAFYELLEKLGQRERIFLFVKSHGGHGQASLRIVNLLRKYCKELVALVPLECASAATMMALGANRILMGPMAYLTAIDTSLTHDLSPIDRDNERVSVSLDELNRVIRLWQQEKGEGQGGGDNPYKSLYAYVHPLVIGAVDRADSLSIMLCKELLSYHIKDAAAAERIAQTLNSRYPSHSYPILLEEAARIGLEATAMDRETNALLLELNQVYSEMGQRATTDLSEIKSHGNEILNILEAGGVQVFFQQDKDWFYRTEERRWISLNDESRWRRVERGDRGVKVTTLHIA
jgi:hypothetical protein